MRRVGTERHDSVALAVTSQDGLEPASAPAMGFPLIALPLGQFRFVPVRELGSGGLGTVEEIRVVASNSRHLVGARLAKKQLNASWRKNPEMIERFSREIAALKTMKHPNILSFEGENLHGEELFYVMPVFPLNARQHLLANKRFGWRNVALFGALLADALEYAHQLGHFHRDLKPENILLNSQGTPVIADWGLGYFVHQYSVVLQDLTHCGMGTKYYCCAEQWNTGKAQAPGDVYALGMTLAELSIGMQETLKFPGEGIQRLIHTDTVGATRFSSVLQSMTQMLVTRRIQSMQAVAAALRFAAQMP